MKKITFIILLTLCKSLIAQTNLGFGAQYNFENLSLKYAAGIVLKKNHASINFRVGYNQLKSDLESITQLDTTIYYNASKLPQALKNETSIMPKSGWELEFVYHIKQQKIEFQIGAFINKSSFLAHRNGFANQNIFLTQRPNGKTLAVGNLSYLDTTENCDITGIGLSYGISYKIGRHLTLNAAIRPGFYIKKSVFLIDASIFDWDRTSEYGFIQAQHSRIGYNTEQFIFRPLAAPVIGMSYLIFSK